MILWLQSSFLSSKSDIITHRLSRGYEQSNLLTSSPVIQRKEHIWDFSVFQRVRLPILVNLSPFCYMTSAFCSRLVRKQCFSGPCCHLALKTDTVVFSETSSDYCFTTWCSHTRMEKSAVIVIIYCSYSFFGVKNAVGVNHGLLFPRETRIGLYWLWSCPVSILSDKPDVCRVDSEVSTSSNY